MKPEVFGCLRDSQPLDDDSQPGLADTMRIGIIFSLLARAPVTGPLFDYLLDALELALELLLRLHVSLVHQFFRLALQQVIFR